MRIIYDIETYPNCFTLSAEDADTPVKWVFEISQYKNESEGMMTWLMWLQRFDTEMVGFNNIGFDYPVLHYILKMGGKVTAAHIYQKAMECIQASDEDRFANTVWPSDRFIKQIDLFKINHFDNKAKMTSLKALEFNMRLDNVEDLPFPVGTHLTQEQIVTLKKYNQHDVTATKAFYFETLPMIAFREELSAKYNKDFVNYNDTKIGSEIFQIALEKEGIECYAYGPNGRQPRQTVRPSIRLGECIPSYIQFYAHSFNRIWDHLRNTTITETKGVFKDLTASAFGLTWVFGTGGIHASVENESFIADDQMMILDLDVTSMYPSIAISNGYYPEHLTSKFVDVYQKLKDQRVGYKKGTPENAMLKLALNGVYGKSNDKYSIFYDPKFTMQVTLTGQLCLAMLAERLAPYGRIIQANTDGITLYVPRCKLNEIRASYHHWERLVGLELEETHYSKMFIADVNSYIATYEGKNATKRKGRYEYDVEWHQDASCLVVPKVAEEHLLHGTPIAETVRNWPHMMDFMLRVKIPRSSRLSAMADGQEYPLSNITRYYVSDGGVSLVKTMPPLKGKTEWRKFSVRAGWTVCPCNDIKMATLPIDYNYYIKEVEALCLAMK